jgi:hypothetical protein
MQNGLHPGIFRDGLRMRSTQQHIQQIVVSQFHQAVHAASLTHGKRIGMMIEKTLNEQIVFQQPTSATPA